MEIKIEIILQPAHNKPIAFMGVEVKTQTSVLRKNRSDYPQYSTLNPPQ